MKNLTRFAAFALFVSSFYLILVSYSSGATNRGNGKKIDKYYQKNKGNNSASVSKGSVSKGSILNSKLLPYSGGNFQYFDKWSYLQGRAFLNGKVKSAVLNTYSDLKKKNPVRKYTVMECSHKEGGKLWPHRTHQNGLSVDFMMPLSKNGEPYYDLDDKGLKHYLLEFNNKGEYEKDKAVKIDFDATAQHILLLDRNARKLGYKIKKVIIKVELKDELYSTTYGKQIKEKGIYVVMGLTSKINALHDDHYHIDFERI